MYENKKSSYAFTDESSQRGSNSSHFFSKIFLEVISILETGDDSVTEGHHGVLREISKRVKK